jgi:hypothetical protein
MKSLDEIKHVLSNHKGELRRKHRVKRIGIFGSYVHGTQKRGSDIDVVAEFEEPVSLMDLVGAELYLKKILGTKVDLIPKKDIRPELKKRIAKDTVYI